MIAVSLALLAFGVFDLVRWSPERGARRSGAALVVATASTAGLAAAAGFRPLAIALVAAVTIATLSAWLAFDNDILARSAPGWALVIPTLALSATFAFSGSAPSAAGALEDWYRQLPFGFAGSVPFDQFLIGVSAGIFLLATGNRIVRLVLEAAGTPVASGETALKGGRMLGPMERIFVLAVILAGDPTGAAIVIAAKGLLRLPEIRRSADHLQGADDQVTEYFLIGTFSSLLLAGAAAVLISACS